MSPLQGYDTLDQIISIVHTKADGSVLASQIYERNLGGEPNKIVREDGSYTLYEYDPVVRLSKEVSYNAAGVAVRSIEYSYDLDGKRTKKVDNLGTHDYTYNTNGQLETVNADTYGYDADGRLEQVTRGGHNLTLTHDTFDRLTQVTKDSTTTQYLYDVNGNRIKEISGVNTKNYLVAPNLADGLESTDLVTDGSGNVVSNYVYGGSEIIARLDASGNPVYYLTDDMGSVIGLVDGSGNLVSRIVYDGFGDVVSGDDGSSLGGDFRFQGQWLEGESGLYYMRARDYDAQTGLFLSRDPIDVQDQGVEAFSPYQFAFNNPLVFSDPTGQFTILEINGTLSIQDTLNAIKSYSVEQVKQQAIGEVNKFLARKLFDVLGTFVPFDIQQSNPFGTVYAALKYDTKLGGFVFETILKHAFCSLLPPMISNYVFYEPEIYRDSFNARNSGYQCPQVVSTAKATSGTSRPDFIVTSGRPRRNTSDGANSYLVGDIKLSFKTIVQEYFGWKGQGASKNCPKQWNTITGYARKHGVNVAGFVTLYNGGKQTIALREKILEKAIAKKVIVLLASAQ